MGSQSSRKESNLNINKERINNIQKFNVVDNINFNFNLNQSNSNTSTSIQISSGKEEDISVGSLSLSSRKTKETSSTITSPLKDIKNNFNANNNNLNLIEKIPFMFEWKEGGTDVKISGSFLDDWKGVPIEMRKNVFTGYFECQIYLEKRPHQFKFIVDGKWICSNFYGKKTDDKNNINNFIDLSIPQENKEKNVAVEKNKEKKSKKDNYGYIYPKINELNSDAPHLPQHYRNKFVLDYQSNQKIVNKIKLQYFGFIQNNVQSENNSYKKLLICPHEKLNHLYSNENDLINSQNNKNLELSSSLRIHHKFLDIVYYCPKK